MVFEHELFKKNSIASLAKIINFQFFLDSLIFSLVVFFFPDSFKLVIPVIFVMVAILFWQSKNVLSSFFLVFLILLQFQSPGKYYTFEVIPANEVDFYAETSGVKKSFAITGSDLLGVYLFFLMISNQVKKKADHQVKLNEKSRRLIKFFIYSYLFYFLVSLFGSINNSHYPMYSVIHLFQELKICLVFWGVVLMNQKNELRKQLFSVLSAIFIFQLVLGANQLFLNTLNPVSQITDDVPRESRLFFGRAVGTFAHSNQYALVCWSLWMSLLGVYLKIDRSRKYLFFLVLAGAGGVIFSQSRAIWLTLGVLIGYFGFIYKKLAKKIIKKNMLMIFVLAVLFVLVIIPRIMLSFNYQDPDSGWTLRQRMITEGIEMIRQAPLWGYGKDTYVYNIFNLFPEGYIKHFPYEIHLAYLQMIAEGSWGSLVFFVPLGWLIITNLKSLKEKKFLGHHLALIGCLGVVIYYCFHPHNGWVEFPWLGLLLGFSIDGSELKTA